jgi:hypothetical protein
MMVHTITRRETFRFEVQLRPIVQSRVREIAVVALNAAVGCDGVRTWDGPSNSGTKENTRPTTTRATPTRVITRFKAQAMAVGRLWVWAETPHFYRFRQVAPGGGSSVGPLKDFPATNNKIGP